MEKKEIVKIKNVSKYYAGVRALNNVSISIKEGEIHCLVGENGSGKSTLIKIISGVEKPDVGEIIINGKLYKNLQPIDAIKEGIQVIYQDLSLFPTLTVGENISLNQFIEKNSKFINWKELTKNARNELQKINIDLNLSEIVENISISNKQLVAICRALTLGAKLIIMDEPTTALTKKEIDSLLHIISKLKRSGISTLFISHKLNEVFQISQKITVLRDGIKVGEEYMTEELDYDKLIYLMTGRRVKSTIFKYKKTNDNRAPVLEVRDLSHKKDFRNISFKLRAGEILGIIGSLGSGRTELALALFGLNKINSGEIYINGNLVKIRSTQDAAKNGIGYLPEDKLIQGLFLRQSIINNLIIVIIEKLLNKFRLIRSRLKKNVAEKLIKDFNIKISSLEAEVQTLSGGNQQKISLAKWISTNPKVFICDSPTVGIDIVSKVSIHKIIRELADSGIGVILISDEMPEITQNCNRAILMKNGNIIKEVDVSKISKEKMYEFINNK